MRELEVDLAGLERVAKYAADPWNSTAASWVRGNLHVVAVDAELRRLAGRLSTGGVSSPRDRLIFDERRVRVTRDYSAIVARDAHLGVANSLLADSRISDGSLVSVRRIAGALTRGRDLSTADAEVLTELSQRYLPTHGSYTARVADARRAQAALDAAPVCDAAAPVGDPPSALRVPEVVSQVGEEDDPAAILGESRMGL